MSADKKNALVLADVPGAVASIAAFQSLKESVLSRETDTATISGRTYIKRSGWRKIALSFNISTEIISVEREQNAKGEWVIHVKAKAVAPNGRFSEEISSCQSSEVTKQKMEPTVHNIETRAATRAINRAISNLVGGGEVSAEEFIDTEAVAESSSPGPSESKDRPATPETETPPQSGTDTQENISTVSILDLPWRDSDYAGVDAWVPSDAVPPTIAEYFKRNGEVTEKGSYKLAAGNFEIYLSPKGHLQRYLQK